MKILFLCYSDGAGGADRASYRHLKGLQQAGVDAKMLVQQKITDDESVSSTVGGVFGKLRATVHNLDSLPLRLYPKRHQITYSVGWLDNGIADHVTRIKPDLIHMEWVCRGFVPVKAISRFKLPIVWTLQDAWPFTGGCHYPGACPEYKAKCGSCPQLGSTNKWDLSRWTWRRKRTYWPAADITVVAISKWLAGCARESSLFAGRRVEVIPNCVDTHAYKPLDRSFARQVLGLPNDKLLVATGAMSMTSDPRKGFDLLAQAMKIVASTDLGKNAELVVFGARKPAQPPDTGAPTHYLGNFSDDVSLSLIYSAADVFVAPSREEAFGQTLIEAMACGVPAIGFDIGGILDIIDHDKTGYIAKAFDTADLANGIARVLGDGQRRRLLTERGIQKTQTTFSIEKVADQYLSLYSDILSSRP